MNRCHFCFSSDLIEIPNEEGMVGVTSDCKVWSRLSKIGVCRTCGYPQAIIDDNWLKDTKEIYENYQIYHQGSQKDHFLFNHEQSTSRSGQLISGLKKKNLIGHRGKLLEIGPGGGNFLVEFHHNYENWDLYASDVNDKNKEQILSLDSVRGFYSSPINQIQERFDLIACVHSLEHIPNPFNFLVDLKKILKPDGKILINVPNCLLNPFVICVADHCSHFEPETLENLFLAVGFKLLESSTAWISKELVLVAENNPNKKENRDSLPLANTYLKLNNHLLWLNKTIKELKNIDPTIKLGCLGTTIAGTWVYAQIKDRLNFFVDEDTGRQGNTHLNLPILSPNQVESGSYLFLAFPYPIAHSIAKKYQKYPYNLILPPKELDL
jgi:2-polyprenyl-3-methyl-5-hydroxy-6-metoxy-1,4-benzoquinol methylase